VGLAAHELMKADVDFDESRGNKITTVRTVYFKNFCRTYIRKELRRDKQVQEVKWLFKNPPIKKGVVDDLNEMVNLLPSRQKEVVQDYFYNNLTFKEIGAKLGVSRQRAEQILSRAIKNLRVEFNV
jgi:RNA polymerase sigma factor (sigma-70 family)